MKDAEGNALDPVINIGKLARSINATGNIVLTPSRKPTEQEQQKLEIDQHLSSLPDPQSDKPGG